MKIAGHVQLAKGKTKERGDCIPWISERQSCAIMRNRGIGPVHYQKQIKTEQQNDF